MDLQVVGLHVGKDHVKKRLYIRMCIYIYISLSHLYRICVYNCVYVCVYTYVYLEKDKNTEKKPTNFNKWKGNRQYRWSQLFHGSGIFVKFSESSRITHRNPLNTCKISTKKHLFLLEMQSFGSSLCHKIEGKRVLARVLARTQKLRNTATPVPHVASASKLCAVTRVSRPEVSAFISSS